MYLNISALTLTCFMCAIYAAFLLIMCWHMFGYRACVHKFLELPVVACLTSSHCHDSQLNYIFLYSILQCTCASETLNHCAKQTSPVCMCLYNTSARMQTQGVCPKKCKNFTAQIKQITWDMQVMMSVFRHLRTHLEVILDGLEIGFSLESWLEYARMGT